MSEYLKLRPHTRYPSSSFFFFFYNLILLLYDYIFIPEHKLVLQKHNLLPVEIFRSLFRTGATTTAAMKMASSTSLQHVPGWSSATLFVAYGSVILCAKRFLLPKGLLPLEGSDGH